MDCLNGEIGSFLEHEAEKENKPELIYGFADIEDVATVEENGVNLTGAVSIGCALNPQSVASLADGLTESYLNEYLSRSDFIKDLSFKLVDFLREKGYEALVLQASLLEDERYLGVEEKEILESSYSPLWALQRFFAAHAGLGWIGKNGLIVTKHYGPSVLLSTIFTNAPLDCATEVFLSRCGRCKECAIACPVGAIDVLTHTPLESADSAIDVEKCIAECERLTSELFGETFHLCGKCVYSCPYTESYLRRKGFSRE